MEVTETIYAKFFTKEGDFLDDTPVKCRGGASHVIISFSLDVSHAGLCADLHTDYVIPRRFRPATTLRVMVPAVLDGAGDVVEFILSKNGRMRIGCARGARLEVPGLLVRFARPVFANTGEVRE